MSTATATVADPALASFGRLLKPADLAATFDVPESQIVAWDQAGLIPRAMKIGRARYWSAGSISRFLEARGIEPEPSRRLPTPDDRRCELPEPRAATPEDLEDYSAGLFETREAMAAGFGMTAAALAKWEENDNFPPRSGSTARLAGPAA